MRARRAGTPPRRIDAEGSRGASARRGPGAVGHRGIVPYRARSPARSAAEGHARTTPFSSCGKILTIPQMRRSTNGDDERGEAALTEADAGAAPGPRNPGGPFLTPYEMAFGEPGFEN